jgi:hypothetical protein
VATVIASECYTINQLLSLAGEVLLLRRCSLGDSCRLRSVREKGRR